MKVVAGILEDGSGQILIALRPAGKRLAGYWEFPGGKIESGESAPAALAREMREELDLEIEVLRPLGIYPFTYDHGPIELHVYVARARGEPKVTESVPEFRWLSGLDIDLDSMAPADHKPLLDYLASART